MLSLSPTDIIGTRVKSNITPSHSYFHLNPSSISTESFSKSPSPTTSQAHDGQKVGKNMNMNMDGNVNVDSPAMEYRESSGFSSSSESNTNPNPNANSNSNSIVHSHSNINLNANSFHIEGRQSSINSESSPAPIIYGSESDFLNISQSPASSTLNLQTTQNARRKSPKAQARSHHHHLHLSSPPPLSLSTFSLPKLSSPPSTPVPRQNSLPVSSSKSGKVPLTQIQANDVLDHLQNIETMIIIDIRCASSYIHSHISRAFNICVPTTLLKRPNYTLQRMLDTQSKSSRIRLNKLIEVYEEEGEGELPTLLIYDTNSPNETISMRNLSDKFHGVVSRAYYVSGGFDALSSALPSDMVENGELSDDEGNRAPSMFMGGCALPKEKSKPFFGQIRQNIELAHGPPVSGHPMSVPGNISERELSLLPQWLIRAMKDKSGIELARKFYKIEKAEQERLDASLRAGADAGKYNLGAGIELGTRNRYKDILPYEHTRVKIRSGLNTPMDIGIECPETRRTLGYVNASHLSSNISGRRYIATQAPLPATFNDFFTMIYEQNVRIVVTLTTEMDQGQVKCHVFWKTGMYGDYQVTLEKEEINGDECVRHLRIEHDGDVRNVVQFQYLQWPDFGNPAEPQVVLKLIEDVRRMSSAEDGNPPVIVHCSAGCGRTGVFCTISYVNDYLLNDYREASEQSMDDTDRICDIVYELRKQRLSMVQTLPQYVLCYEVILLQYLHAIRKSVTL